MTRDELLVLLARHKPVLNRENMAPCTHRVMGAFLKLELSLLPELANDEFVLYCDTDVFFNRPIDGLKEIKPSYMGMAREQTAVISSPTALSGKGEVPGTVEHQQ